MRRRTKLIIGSSASLVVGAIGSVLLTHWISNSSQGTVSVGTMQKSSLDIPAESLAINTPYFSTSLPAGYTIKRQDNTLTTTTVLQLVAATNSDTDQQVGIGISHMPSNGFDGISGFYMRKNSADYKQITLPYLPTGAVAYSGPGAPNYAIYWPHGAYYAEIGISTTGGSTSNKLQAVFTQAMAAWQWN